LWVAQKQAIIYRFSKWRCCQPPWFTIIREFRPSDV